MGIKLFTKLPAPLFSIGSNQPFPIKPLSESKNRLLDSESQWLEDGAEEGVVRPGNSCHLRTWLRLVKMRVIGSNKCGKTVMWYFKIPKWVGLFNETPWMGGVRVSWPLSWRQRCGGRLAAASVSRSALFTVVSAAVPQPCSRRGSDALGRHAVNDASTRLFFRVIASAYLKNNVERPSALWLFVLV